MICNIRHAFINTVFIWESRELRGNISLGNKIAFIKKLVEKVENANNGVQLNMNLDEERELKVLIIILSISAQC